MCQLQGRRITPTFALNDFSGRGVILLTLGLGVSCGSTFVSLPDFCSCHRLVLLTWVDLVYPQLIMVCHPVNTITIISCSSPSSALFLIALGAGLSGTRLSQSYQTHIANYLVVSCF